MTWELNQKTIPKGTELANYTKNGGLYYQTYEEDTSVEVLEKDGVVWMSNTRMEQDTASEFIKQARGRILIGGLGMGWVIEQIQNKPEVESITIIELDETLIPFICGAKKFNDKVFVIHDDIFHYLAKTEAPDFDVIWLDIWAEICPDNLVEMYPLEHLARKKLKKDGTLLQWCQEVCERMTYISFGQLPPKRAVIEAGLKQRGYI